MKTKDTPHQVKIAITLATAWDYYTQDIENVFSKPWLKMAIVSHMQKDTGISEDICKGYVDYRFEIF